MNKLNDALGSLARQLQERHSDDAETPITLTVERAQALFEAIAAPQPQQWVGLTDDDLREIESRMLDMGTVFDLMCLIEAKLKEKNT